MKIKQNLVHTLTIMMRKTYKDKRDKEEEESKPGSFHQPRKRDSYSISTIASSSPLRHKKKSKQSYNFELKGDFKNIKAPIFEGELDSGGKVEKWLLRVYKYFHVYAYPNELKLCLEIYNLNGKVARWWRDLKLTKGIKEGRMDWEEFKRLFKEKYLSEIFYDKKIKEFHDLKSGSMKMDGFITKFMELLHYVPYIKEERKRFLSYLPTYIA